MLTADSILAVEKVLDKTFDAEVLPEHKAFPTSGSTFIRITGHRTEIQRNEQDVGFFIQLAIHTSIRTRTFNIKTRRTPYLELLNLSEKIYIKLLEDRSVRDYLLGLHPRLSFLTEYIAPHFLDTEPQGISPSFFGSDDYSSERKAGYAMTQYLDMPKMSLPIDCFELPDSVS